MIIFWFLISVLWLPVNLFYWLAEGNPLSGLAALFNCFVIALCFFPPLPKENRK